ncbi:hypothetical protein [Labilithrix luteola]|nr:hypothetical protein [Labilithrix luteola]
MTEGETGASQEDDQDRPTVSPPFDPAEFAREVLAPPPGGQKNDFHSRVTPQGTSRQALYAAGVSATNRPHSGAPRGASDRAGPAGLLSLANARIPSNLPPRRRDVASAARGSSWEPKEESGWGDFATQPPPAPTFGHDDDPLHGIDDDQPTQPPPPIQQELIDALAQSAKPSGVRGDYEDIVDAPVSSVNVEAEPTTREMNDRISLGDYTGALDVAEKLLAIDPSDVGVRACAETCRSVLRQMYSARLGPLDRVPVVMVPRDQFRWLSIDHRAGFVLSLIDGVSTLEMLLDVSGMPELDALRILSDLAQQRIISFR